MDDRHQPLPNMHFVLPGRDLHQEQDLPLRSDWRFPESGAIVFGNVEIRRTLALFWTRVYNRFCAITDYGLLLIYGDNERGLAIDLKDLRGIHSNIVDKKLSNGTFMPRCLITLRHKCGESLVMCVRGKNEIAKWRCAIWSVIQSDDHQHSSIAPSHALNRRSVSVSNATDASNFHLTPPTDPDEVEYWNNPASGKPMTSPKIYRALSQHASMHRSAMNTSASHSKLALSSSFCYGNRKSFRKASVSPQKELFLKKANTAMDILSYGRSTLTLPSKAITSHENQPHFRIGSLRVEKNSSTSSMQRSPSGDGCNRSPKGGLSSTEEAIAQQTHVRMETQSSPQARPSTASSDSGVASRAESPSKMILSSEGVSNGDNVQTVCDIIMDGDDKSSAAKKDIVLSSLTNKVNSEQKQVTRNDQPKKLHSSTSKVYRYRKDRKRQALPLLTVDSLNLEGIFEEVLSYLREDTTQWRS